MNKHEKENEKYCIDEDYVMELKRKKKDLVLKQGIPSLATQSVTDDELEDVEREVSDETVNPYHTCPSPANALDSCKFPVCVHGDCGSHLFRHVENLVHMSKLSCV